MENQFTTLLWDLDGTLLDFKYSQRYALTKCFETIGRRITEEELALYSRINDSFWKRLELGEITKKELLPGRFIRLFQELGIEGVDVEAFRQEYQVELGNKYCYIDDSLELCKSFQGKIHQYIVTNGVAMTQRNKIALSGLGEVMEQLFISEEIGYPKPQQAFFAYCLEKIPEKDKEKILIVGDSLTSDIKGGKQAQIKTCWYHPSQEKNDTQWQADYEIHKLQELHEILGI